jgi:serine/threonine protein kinase
VSGDIAANRLEATLREFVEGQKLFGRYRLSKTLGRGGMGIVWLARDEELERDVALKFLPDLIIHDRAVLDDLKRETRRSLELTHKNIVRIYDFVHDQMSGCISMEYIDGDTLSNLRADKPRNVFEPDELSDWISQLCDALDYAHNHAQIVHRDLKPANLMVNQRGDLKVADFGIARSLRDSVSKLTIQNARSGTLVYMSPQQLEGERGTLLDDIYSMGATIYELLTSRPPFYSGNVDQQIRERIPPPMMQRRSELEVEGEPIDRIWEDVIQACLAKSPERRPQSTSEVARRLQLPSLKTQRAKRIQSQDHSNKWRRVLAVGVALLIVGLVAWLIVEVTPTSRRARSTSAPARSTPVGPIAPTPIATRSTTGSAVINTSPSGARVTLGDQQLLSPAKFDQFSRGMYMLRVELDGYETVIQQIEIKEDESTELATITLRPYKPTEAPTPAESAKSQLRPGASWKTSSPEIIASAQLSSKQTPFPQKTKQRPERFAGMWSGKIKFGNAGDVQLTLTVNPAASRLKQQSKQFGEQTHVTNNTAQSLSWTTGTRNEIAWTLTPNNNGATASVTAQSATGINSRAVFHRVKPNSVPAEAKSPPKMHPGAKLKRAAAH